MCFEGNKVLEYWSLDGKRDPQGDGHWEEDHDVRDPDHSNGLHLEAVDDEQVSDEGDEHWEAVAVHPETLEERIKLKSNFARKFVVNLPLNFLLWSKNCMMKTSGQS